MSKLRLIVLISGHGSNLQAIIDAIANRMLNAEIMLVISNRADAYGLLRAKQAGIMTEVVSVKQLSDRQKFDEALIKLIEPFTPDLVLLAGFMHILPSEFVRHFAGKILNIHPSLLPKYPGLHTHRQVLAAGDKEHGCTVHYVTEDLDAGPIIAQEKCEVLPNDTEDMLRERVLKLEHQLYVKVLQTMGARLES
ncbi:MAG: phosphoribosylglycinamide formyltransferase [Gammaproteobacteria bacterium]